MNNTENPTTDECACGINYEAAYQDAMRKIDMLWEENKSLKIVVRELSKLISQEISQ